MRDSAAAAAAAATMAAVLLCCCCCYGTHALPELQSAAVAGDAVRLGDTWRTETRDDRRVGADAKAGAVAKRTEHALDHVASNVVGVARGGGGGGSSLPSRPDRVRALAPKFFAAGRDAPLPAPSRAPNARARRSSGVASSANELRDRLIGGGGGGGWGPSVQDLRDTIIPRLRQLELTMDRATFLVLWHLISNNVHGSWEDAAARYGGGGAGGDAHVTTATQNKRLCVRSGGCLNGGKCYYETEDSKAWSCSCPRGFWGRRCQHGSKHQKEDSDPGSNQSHSRYASWSTSWTGNRR